MAQRAPAPARRPRRSTFAPTLRWSSRACRETRPLNAAGGAAPFLLPFGGDDHGRTGRQRTTEFSTSPKCPTEDQGQRGTRCGGWHSQARQEPMQTAVAGTRAAMLVGPCRAAPLTVPHTRTSPLPNRERREGQGKPAAWRPASVSPGRPVARFSAYCLLPCSPSPSQGRGDKGVRPPYASGTISGVTFSSSVKTPSLTSIRAQPLDGTRLPSS